MTEYPVRQEVQETDPQTQDKGLRMKHYVITRTIFWRFEAKDWEDAVVWSKNPIKISKRTIEMVEEETGREEVLSG